MVSPIIRIGKGIGVDNVVSSPSSQCQVMISATLTTCQ